MVQARAHTLNPHFFIPALDSQQGCERAPGALLNVTTGELVRANCKQWLCKWCGPRRAKRFYRRIHKVPFTRFVTLTMPPARGGLTGDNIRLQAHGWRMFTQFLRRNGAKGHYACTREVSASGRLHLHALIHTSWFSYKRARQCIERSGLGAVCDFRKVRQTKSGVAGYLTKYLAKDLGNGTVWPRYTRRAWTSAPAERPTNSEWIFFRKAPSPTPRSGLQALRNDASREYTCEVTAHAQGKPDNGRVLWIELSRASGGGRALTQSGNPPVILSASEPEQLALITEDKLHHAIARAGP